MGEASSAPDQIISLPSGGGAMRGLGETFSPDLQTGTGNLVIPIKSPPGRNGMEPRLALRYSTGRANGPLGLGWALSVPRIARMTAHGVPTYRDSDKFVVSGADELLPVERLGDGTRYRPQTEADFARIVHHGFDSRAGPGSPDYWEVIGKDGLVSVYGTLPSAGVSSGDPALTVDPQDPSRIFAWELTSTSDPLGNLVEYEYAADACDVDGHRWRRPMLRRIRYVDHAGGAGSLRFLVTISLDDEARPDTFSAYTSGFEVRTARRYRSLTVAVHPGDDQLVCRYEFGYEQDEYDGASLLTRVTLVGFAADGTERRELPPVRLRYGALAPDRRRFRRVEGTELPGVALSRRDYELCDLTGNGLPDVLQLNGVARYWRNLGSGVFDIPRSMPASPAGLSLGDPGVQLLDAQGDGRADLTVTIPGLAGYFPLRFGPSWGPLHRYRAVPATPLQDPAMQLVDLTGDGVTDAALAGAGLECFFNDPRTGWSGPRRARFAPDPAGADPPPVSGPDLHLRWADMSGDGLQDLVWLYSGSVTYRPNLGHGVFGAPVRMHQAPRLPVGYNPRRLLLGDVDGDGVADLVHAAGGVVTVWFNRTGNAWSAPVTIPGVPEDVWDVRLTDLLGTGTSGVLFSRDAAAAGPGRTTMLFLDLTGGGAPRLLEEIDNQLGAVTRIGYAPATRFATEDAARPATRWRTPLPVPVTVVERVETIDAVSGGKLTTTFRYRHGYWSGRDREFRGFARVDQADTETFAEYHGSGLHGDQPFTPVAAAVFSPPTLTRTWFHVGDLDADIAADARELDLSAEYWDGDPAVMGHGAAVDGLLRSLATPDSAPDLTGQRDAMRALRGKVLRTELYALDGSARESRPYTVSEHAWALREEPTLREPGDRRAFAALESAHRITEWERGDDPMTRDPMTRVTLIDDYDAYGQPRRRTEVALPRRETCRHPVTAAVIGTFDPDPDTVIATCTRTVYAVALPGGALHDRIAEVRRYELTDPPAVAERDPADSRSLLVDQAQAARAVAGAFAAGSEPDVRLIGHDVHHYDGPAFTGLPAGEVGQHGLLTRTERLVFTDGVLDGAFGQRRPQPLGGPEPAPTGAPPGALQRLGYRQQAAGPVYAAGWYADATARAYDIQLPGAGARGTLRVLRDPLGHETKLALDPYEHLPAQVTDAAGLVTTATYDYRTGRPSHVTDANGTATNVAYTALGLVERVYVVDRDGRGGTPERPEAAHRYDFMAFAARGQPVSVQTRRRVWHATDADSDDTVETREYSDGFGRLLQTRAQADELAFGPDGDDSGLLGPGAAGPATGERRADRVVVSGWIVRDNKGRPVETYDPFLAAGWDFQPAVDARRGRHVARFYDARGRAERVLSPDGSQRRVVFGTPGDLMNPGGAAPTPWTATTYDENDLAAVSTARDQTSLAAAAAVEHHYTPATTIVDARGRALCALARGGPAPGDQLATRTTYDVRGNVLTIVDPVGRTAVRHAFDLSDRLLRTDAIDGGRRLMLADAAGNPVLSRDGREALTLRTFDAMNRPATVHARDDAAAALTLRERTIYGDALPPGPERDAAVAAQCLGRVRTQQDGAGRLDVEAYDHEGRVLAETRTVISDQALAAGWRPDWDAPAAAAALEPTGLTTHTRFDALGRAVEVRAPDGRTIVPGYGRSGALRSVSVDGSVFVREIARNARGQRVLIAYGNGLVTRYGYNADTFRLRRMRTEPMSRAGDAWTATGAQVQDLTYSYDLVGNVTGIEERVASCGVAGTPTGRDGLVRLFGYDPHYRLVSATGRACADIACGRSLTDAARCGAVTDAYVPGPAVPSQSNAPELTAAYVERYRYDEADNLLDLCYRPTSGPVTTGWHRLFGISGCDPGESAGALDNRLTSVRNGSQRMERSYDAVGNVLTEGTTRSYGWDHAGRLISFTVQAGGGVSKQARYLHDAGGRRIKKWVRSGVGGAHDESTIYLGMLAERERWTAGRGGEGFLLHVLDGNARIAVTRSGDQHPDDLGPPVRYELADHLLSSCVTVDDTGAWITREEYFAYGETSFGSFRRKRYRFGGMERDEESGLQPLGSRSYAPSRCRWMSADPEGVTDTVNLYAYCRGSPVGRVDPGGTQSRTADNLSSGQNSAAPAAHSQAPASAGARTV